MEYVSLYVSEGVMDHLGEKENATLIIVRHGERADEASPQEWYDFVCSTYASEEIRYFRLNDPPLTRNGELQASNAAETLSGYIASHCLPVTHVFCSRLTRCIQTAYPIAKRLNLPLVVCSGLALTAAAVERCQRKKKKFQFISIDEIRRLCPDVQVFDGDEANDAMSKIPHNTWKDPISFLESTFSTSLIVAHRETIRNLSGIYQNIPYCAFALIKSIRFDNTFKIDRLVTYTGENIRIRLPSPSPPSSPVQCVDDVTDLVLQS